MDQVVGIAADVKVRGAAQSTQVETFVPYWQFTEPGMVAIVKTASNPAKLTSEADERKLAAIALSMWKSKEKYDPTKHSKQGS